MWTRETRGNFQATASTQEAVRATACGTQGPISALPFAETLSEQLLHSSLFWVLFLSVEQGWEHHLPPRTYCLGSS